VFGGKYIQEMSRKTYKLNKEAATIEDVEAVHPDLIIVKKDVDAEKLFEINPDLVIRNLSRYYTLENYDPSRHVQRA
jgi:ABC-type Fe3+-hydroxamate transport system substrate-binding protein